MKDCCPNILFFPGIHRLENELKYFFTLTKQVKHISHFIYPLPYDVGVLSSKPFEEWLNKNQAIPSWWIGLSLGASLAWYFAATIKEEFLPKRLTLVNPFSNRRELAQFKGFSMENQWDLNLENIDIPSSINVSAIISSRDTKIPLFCKQRLLDKIPKSSQRFIDTDHCLSDKSAQLSMFNYLFDNERL